MNTKEQSLKSLSAELKGQNEEILQNDEMISPAYLGYPPADDIYNRDKEMKDINPEDISAKKSPNELNGNPVEIDFSNDYDGGDLDVPGAELDDADEKIGEEDEENNYYSIGGDNHNDLEEDQYD